MQITINAPELEEFEKKLEEVRLEIQSLTQKIAASYPAENDVLTMEKAMKLLSMSRNTLDRLRKEGVLRSYKLRGTIYFRYSEIMQALEDNPYYK